MSVKGPGTWLVDNEASCLTGAGGQSLLSMGMKEGKAQDGKEAQVQSLLLRQEHRSFGWGRRKWGEEKAELPSQGRHVCFVADWKKRKGIYHMFMWVSRQNFKSFHWLKLRRTSFQQIPTSQQKTCCWAKSVLAKEERRTLRTKHLCYQWSGPRTRGWGNKLLTASPAFELPFGLPSGTFSSSVIKDSLNWG